MPRANGSSSSYQGPSKEDLAEFMEILGGDAVTRIVFPLSKGQIGRLIEDVTALGYAMRIAPIMGGGGRSVTIYLGGDQKIERQSGDPQKFEEEVALLVLAAKKLPRRREP